MRADIRDGLKSLRLHGMIMTWEAILENSGGSQVESAKWKAPSGCSNTCHEPRTPTGGGARLPLR